MKGFLLALAIAVSPAAVVAQAENVVCPKIGEMAFNMALARDAGVPLIVLQTQVLSNDADYVLQEFAVNLLSQIYDNPQVNPQAIGVAAYASCIQAFSNM